MTEEWREELKKEFWEEDIDSEYGGSGYIDWGGKDLPDFISQQRKGSEY